jgi:anti-sigma factor RsiW
MKCLDKKTWLSYLRGEMDEKLGREIRIHLESCSKCKALASELSIAYDSLDLIPAIKHDYSIISKVKLRIGETRQEKGWERAIVPAVAAFVGALSIVMGAFLGRSIYEIAQGDDSSQDAYTSNVYYGGGVPNELMNLEGGPD